MAEPAAGYYVSQRNDTINRKRTVQVDIQSHAYEVSWEVRCTHTCLQQITKM